MIDRFSGCGIGQDYKTVMSGAVTLTGPALTLALTRSGTGAAWTVAMATSARTTAIMERIFMADGVWSGEKVCPGWEDRGGSDGCGLLLKMWKSGVDECKNNEGNGANTLDLFRSEKTTLSGLCLLGTRTRTGT